MITLFVLKGEAVAYLVFIALSALYVWIEHLLAKHPELDTKIRNMTDDELIGRFHDLMDDHKKKATYRKGQELKYYRKEMKKRHLL